MIISLNKEAKAQQLYILVIGNNLYIKDYSHSWKEKNFDSRQSAINEAEKITANRVKNKAWEISGKTLSDFYLQKMKHLSQRLETEFFNDSLNKIAYIPSTQYWSSQDTHIQLVQTWPAQNTHIQNLELKCSIHAEEIPSDYLDFLLSMNGCSVEGKIEKNLFGSNFLFRFVSTYRQKWFQENKNNFECLKDLKHPFIVLFERGHSTVSREGYSEFLGSVLMLPSGSVETFDGDMHMGTFNTFQDYFEYEIKEILQAIYEAKEWVNRKVGF
jgi:hypothetical protein